MLAPVAGRGRGRRKKGPRDRAPRVAAGGSSETPVVWVAVPVAPPLACGRARREGSTKRGRAGSDGENPGGAPLRALWDYERFSARCGATTGVVTSRRTAWQTGRGDQHDDEDQQEQTEAAARVVAPARAVRPGREAADQEEEQEDEEDERKCTTHMTPLWSGRCFPALDAGY